MNAETKALIAFRKLMQACAIDAAGRLTTPYRSEQAQQLIQRNPAISSVWLECTEALRLLEAEACDCGGYDVGIGKAVHEEGCQSVDSPKASSTEPKHDERCDTRQGFSRNCNCQSIPQDSAPEGWLTEEVLLAMCPDEADIRSGSKELYIGVYETMRGMALAALRMKRGM